MSHDQFLWLSVAARERRCGDVTDTDTNLMPN